MNDSDIKRVLETMSLGAHVKVYVYNDVDSLPKQKISNAPFECYIFNFHDNGDMGHWLCLARNNNEMWFFDSMGFSPHFYSIKIYDTMKRHNILKRYRNKTQYQNISSIVCGGYQLCYVYLLNKTRDFKKCIFRLHKLFPHRRNRQLNDKLLINFMYRTFGGLDSCKTLFCNYYTITKKDCDDLCDE